MDEFRYNDHAQALEDALVTELTEHRDERAANEEAAAQLEAASKESGMDFVAGGRSPREVVEDIVRGKREQAEEMIREHEVGKKMAEMALAGRRSVDAFLEDVKG
jgi:hypothetical protein